MSINNQQDYRQYFRSAANADDVWQRLHSVLAEFGVTHVFYALGYLADIISQEHLDGVLQQSSIPHKFNYKTSYPDELLRRVDGEFRLEQDLSALHSVIETSPFVWSDREDYQAAMSINNDGSEASFWFDVKLVGVTLPLRFGTFGKGGMGLYMSRLSEQQFHQIWGNHKDDIISIISYFDEVVREKFLDLLGISFTKREKDILAFLAQGFSAKMIAKSLGTKVNTVQNQIMELRRRLGAKNNVQLVTIALTFEVI